jgi:hypothetical protein
MPARLTAPLLALCLALAACGGDDAPSVDRDAILREIERQDYPPNAQVDALADIYVDLCGEDVDAVALFLAMSIDVEEAARSFALLDAGCPDVAAAAVEALN